LLQRNHELQGRIMLPPAFAHGQGEIDVEQVEVDAGAARIVEGGIGLVHIPNVGRPARGGKVLDLARGIHRENLHGFVAAFDLDLAEGAEGRRTEGG
jgi:hypothetical protein